MGIRFTQIKRVFKIAKIRGLSIIWERSGTKIKKVNIFISWWSKPRLNLGIIFEKFK